MQMKLLPEHERPVEKVWAGGVGKLTNAELLALILHTGTKDKSAIGLAGDVLAAFPEGLGELAVCCPEDLTRIDGIGQTKAQAVVNYRDAHGGFSSVEEIMNVDGIKEGLYNRIRDQIKVK